MRHTYRFPCTPELRDLVVEVENRGDQIIIDMSRSGSQFLAPFVDAYFQSLNEMGPLTVHKGLNVYTLYWPPVPTEAHARFFEAFWRTWFFRKPTPPVVTIAITDKCQCRCVHCSAAATDSTRSELSVQSMEKIVNECVSLGVSNIIFTGGEPLLHEDLEACVSLVPRDKAISQVFTNAVALDAKRVTSLKAAGLYVLKISLDSPDPAEHDRLRRYPGAFAAVERGVKAGLDAGLLVGLSTYSTNDSARNGSLNRIAQLAAEWGVHEVTVFDAIPSGRLHGREDVLLTAENRQALLKQARELNKAYVGKTRLLTQSWTNSGSRFAKYVGCLAATSQFHITPAGDLTPCDFTPLSFGNVHEEPIADLWRKLTEHSEYQRHCQDCRMQDPGFRQKYIHPIPGQATLPYPIELLDMPGQN